MASSKIHAGRLILDVERDGALNMAADYGLADRAENLGILILRLYKWKRPTLSVGYHQRVDSALVRNCENLAIPIVRRPTGGRAVLHDEELTYSLSLPTAHPLFVPDREGMFKSIASILVEAARRANIGAEMVRADCSGSKKFPLHKGSPLCFDSVSRWEVKLDGRKWIGIAGRFFPGVFLQQGSILMGNSAISPADLLSEDNLLPEGLPKFTTKINGEALVEAIPKAFGLKWGIDWKIEPLSEIEVAEFSALGKKYEISTEPLVRLQQATI